MDTYPHYDSEFYKKAMNKAKLIRELGEAVYQENGEEACIKMLTLFKETQAKKNLDKPK